METARIADIADINPRVPRELAESPDREVNFVPMSHLSERGEITCNGTRPVREVLKGYTYFANGDVIVAKITPCMENGKAALVRDLPCGVAFGSTEFHVLRPRAMVEPRYLFYMLWNPAFRHAASQNMTGTAGQKRVPAGFIERFQVPLPPLREQRRIATLLEVAQGIELKRRQGIPLSGHLLRSTFLEVFGDPAKNTRKWAAWRIDDIVSETQYGTAEKSNSDGIGMPVLRMNNLTYEGGIDLTDVKWCKIAEADVPKFTVEKGDLLFNRTNSPELVGKTAIWDRDESYAYAGYLFRVRFKENIVLPAYVSAFLNSDFGKKMLYAKAKPSNNMSNLSAGEFRRIELPVPDINLQHRFAAAITQIKAVERTRLTAIAESARLFASLVHRAFKGEL